MTEARETVPLDYAPVAPLRRRRRNRLIAMFLFAVVMTIIGVRWGPRAGSTAILLYHQRNCLRHVAAADQVVFDSNPARVALLAGDPNYVISGGCAFRKPPDDWVAVRPAVNFRTAGPSAMIFLHELKIGDVSRLVEVERIVGASSSLDFIPGYDLETHTLVPATFSHRQLSELPLGWDIDVMDSIGPHLDIRIYAGQIDPADPSHFTIRYETAGKPATADGYLRADGRVEFKLTAGKPI